MWSWKLQTVKAFGLYMTQLVRTPTRGRLKLSKILVILSHLASRVASHQTLSLVIWPQTGLYMRSALH